MLEQPHQVEDLDHGQLVVTGWLYEVPWLLKVWSRTCPCKIGWRGFSLRLPLFLCSQHLIVESCVFQVIARSRKKVSELGFYFSWLVHLVQWNKGVCSFYTGTSKT